MNPTISYAIKSHDRVDFLRKKTLALLQAQGIDLGHVHVFVSGAQQEAAYAEAFGDLGVRVVCVEESGVMAAVAAIQRHFPVGAPVVHLDDDIAGLDMLTEQDGSRALVPFTEFKKLCEDAFALCKRVQTNLWGIYPVHNKMFMRPNTTMNLKFIWAGCYGFVSDGANAEPPSVNYKDDFERSIRSYLRFGAVVRFNYISARTSFLTRKGGTGSSDQEARRLALHVADARELARRYPQLCYVVKKKGFGGLDLRLRSNP